MAKASRKITITCESCEEQDAIKKVEDLGFVCADCLDSYEKMEDDETNLGDLDDKEIDELIELDEATDPYEDEDLVLSAHELKRQGFILDDGEEEY